MGAMGGDRDPLHDYYELGLERDRLADPDHAAVILDSARALEHVPELLGTGSHLLAVARRPSGTG